jgi:signal transduction histidine kinase
VQMELDAPPAADSAAGQVRADHLRLRQVLVNLLSNAIKYNRRGGEVRLEAHHEEGRMAVLRVVDTGVGIAPAHLPSLFEPFNRLGQRRSAIEGTGIGLAITRGLVTLMHGRIDVNSVLDKGSTFSVTLPDASPPAPQDVSLPM